MQRMRLKLVLGNVKQLRSESKSETHLLLH